MIKKVTWDHVSGSKNVEEFITETHPFDVKYDTNPLTGEKTKTIGFYPVGKNRRRWSRRLPGSQNADRPAPSAYR